jgi:hypothetical protein
MKIKIVLLITLLLAFGSISFAQAKKNKKSVTPTFAGSPDAKFKAFAVKNVGKRVSLKITFTEDTMPYGYRSDQADPVFGVDSASFFLECKEKMTGDWTKRCKALNWNDADKTFSGFFKITEPDPKLFRTNRMFYLTPTK